MDSDIENSTKQIKILIRTNIPGKDGFVELTKNMLDVKDKSGMSDYPYFSENFISIQSSKHLHLWPAGGFFF
jgi:hypothetical protein